MRKMVIHARHYGEAMQNAELRAHTEGFVRPSIRVRKGTERGYFVATVKEGKSNDAN